MENEKQLDPAMAPAPTDPIVFDNFLRDLATHNNNQLDSMRKRFAFYARLLLVLIPSMFVTLAVVAFVGGLLCMFCQNPGVKHGQEYNVAYSLIILSLFLTILGALSLIHNVVSYLVLFIVIGTVVTLFGVFTLIGMLACLDSTAFSTEPDKGFMEQAIMINVLLIGLFITAIVGTALYMLVRLERIDKVMALAAD